MKAGDLVKIRCNIEDNLIGVVTWVDMKYPPQCGVLIEGQHGIQDYRVLEVLNEGR